MENTRFNKIQNDFDNLSKDYDVLIPKLVPGYLELKLAIINQIKNLKLEKANFLDIGCGTAILGEEILQLNKKYRYYGIDLSKQMINIAKFRLNKFKNRAQFKKENVVKINKLLLSKIDIIISNLALHHFKDKIPIYTAISALAIKHRSSFILGDLVTDPFKDRDAYHFRVEHMKNVGMRVEEIKSWFKRWENEDKPSTIDENIRYLNQAGFLSKMIWKNRNYAVFFCTIKS